MKIFNMICALLIAFALFNNPNVHANVHSPTFILMKFTDDTRYDEIDSANELSNLVMVEISQSGKLNLMLSNPLNENIEGLLYDEKVREYNILEKSMNSNDFNKLFESVGFNENRAQSIATAQVGQIISPEITSKIGKEHNADYLIQGTIINLGVGNWWDSDYEEMSSAINMTSALNGMSSNSDFSGIMSPLGFGGMDVNKTGIGVQCDVRIIQAETGKVIWCKRVTKTAIQRQYEIGPFSIGKGKLNSTLYAKAMDKAAKQIVKLLIADINDKKLFY